MRWFLFNCFWLKLISFLSDKPDPKMEEKISKKLGQSIKGNYLHYYLGIAYSVTYSEVQITWRNCLNYYGKERKVYCQVMSFLLITSPFISRFGWGPNKSFERRWFVSEKLAARCHREFSPCFWGGYFDDSCCRLSRWSRFFNV